MDFIAQLRLRRKSSGKTVPELSRITGIEVSNLYRTLKSEADVRSSTLGDLASALDCQWVLVPKHLLPEIERLISGKPIGMDDAPSTVDRFLADK
ncbi:MAG: helix-turn-helix domain-containing protein [Burkholderiales bacterium]|nr:helix-turn-helix domain-containing protein [Burkholderiales bacterium]